MLPKWIYFFFPKSVTNYWLHSQWWLGLIVMFCCIVSDKTNIILLMKINVQILFLGQNANVVSLMVMNIINRTDLKTQRLGTCNTNYLNKKTQYQAWAQAICADSGETSAVSPRWKTKATQPGLPHATETCAFGLFAFFNWAGNWCYFWKYLQFHYHCRSLNKVTANGGKCRSAKVMKGSSHEYRFLAGRRKIGVPLICFLKLFCMMTHMS